MDEKNNNALADICRLTDTLMQLLPAHGSYPTSVPGLVLHRREILFTPENCFNKPVLAVTVQGAKRTIVGTEEYRYGAGYCLLAGVDMPSMSYITEASPEKPYLVLSLELDSRLITQLAASLPVKPSSCSGCTAVGPVDPAILHALVHLVELLDTPEQLAVLAPILVQEIHTALLLGPAGGLLKNLNTRGTQSHQVLRGIHWLREHVADSLDVEALALSLHMAAPTFRKYFKIITGMSPTRYHQHLRLYEAQRLMLEENKDAADACYGAGYESLSQFNREYKRLFGEPPLRNVRGIVEKNSRQSMGVYT